MYSLPSFGRNESNVKLYAFTIIEIIFDEKFNFSCVYLFKEAFSKESKFSLIEFTKPI